MDTNHLKQIVREKTDESIANVLSIKVHANIYFLLDIREISTNIGTKYIGLVRATTKLNTNIRGNSMDFGFIWLLGNGKVATNVGEKN